MFNPNKASGDKAAKAALKKALANLKNWCLSIIPVDMQPGTIFNDPFHFF